MRDPGIAVSLCVALGLGGCVIGENPYWDPNASTSSSGTSTATSTATTAGGPTTSAGTSLPTGTTGSTGPEATTGPPGTMGQPCTDDASCDEGQSCCESLQCLDTCSIFCALEPGICPQGMLCAHGYCLLRCDDDDQDCAAWPGFTCEHDGMACENYEPPESTGGGGSSGASTGV